MPLADPLRCLGRRQVSLSRQPRQEQGIGERLRVSVGKLVIVGVREQVGPPVHGERREGG